MCDGRGSGDLRHWFHDLRQMDLYISWKDSIATKQHVLRLQSYKQSVNSIANPVASKHAGLSSWVCSEQHRDCTVGCWARLKQRQ